MLGAHDSGEGACGNWAEHLETKPLQILCNTKATGLVQANGKGLKRYYESPNAEAYKAYRASTSILLPMVGYKHVPMWLKRTLFFDLAMYEYRPRRKKGE